MGCSWYCCSGGMKDIDAFFYSNYNISANYKDCDDKAWIQVGYNMVIASLCNFNDHFKALRPPDSIYNVLNVILLQRVKKINLLILS